MPFRVWGQRYGSEIILMLCYHQKRPYASATSRTFFWAGVVLVLLALVLWPGVRANAQSNFTGMIKPLDCANYTGTDADYSTSYSTLFRDTEDGRTTGYYEGIGSHPGVDIDRLSSGQGDVGAPIRAIYDGYVSSAWQNVSTGCGKDWGYCLIIKHTDIPDAGTIYSCYAHMSRFDKDWKQGQFIAKGTTLGYVGNTGHSTGSHLHFQIDKDYSDYGGCHPWYPSNVNTIDTNGIVLKHSINPMKFVQDHSNASGGVFDPSNVYVSLSGSDASNGSSGAPYRTIKHAIDMASATQATIYIAPGSYGEKISTSKHIHFVTNGNGTVQTGG